MKTATAWLLALSLSGCAGAGTRGVGPAGTRSPFPSSPEREQLIERVDELFAPWNTPDMPGAAVLVTHGEKNVLRRCYGLASVEHRLPITPATRFELASVSKPFTAFAVLLLEQAGELNLEDDIHRYLPELPPYASPIRVRDLLYHTSGLSDWVRVGPYAGLRPGDAFSLDDLLALVGNQRVLEFSPGTKWSYSNTNYALLAEIVARVTGRSFAAWTSENVFGPLGMNDTSFPADGARLVPNRAQAYYVRGGELVRSQVEHFQVPGPAHAFSTIDDMAKWIDNLRTGRVGGRVIAEKMQTRGTLTNGEEIFYGAGLGVGEYRGLRTTGHSGQTGAFKTELLYCPDLEVGVVILANAGSLRPDRLARDILDLYLADRLDPVPEEAAGGVAGDGDLPFLEQDPSQYTPFLGGYRLEGDPSVLMAVAREDEELVGVIVGVGLDFFRPIGEAEFENSLRSCRLTFVGEKNGLAERVRVRLRGEEMWARRVETSGTGEWTADCTGLYYSDELEIVYEIARENDGFTVRCRRFGKRSLQPADRDILAGGIGILTFLRDDAGRVRGFSFGEPEDLGERQIAFTKFRESEPTDAGGD